MILIVEKNIRKLIKLTGESSWKIYQKSFQESSHTSRKRMILMAVSFIIWSLITKILFFKYSNAIDIMINILEVFMAVLIPLLAVTITGYTIFQALISKNAAFELLKINFDNKKQTPMLIKYSLYFYNIVFNLIILFILNIILIIFFKNIDNTIMLPCISQFNNEVLSSILISFYININLWVLIELKSFVHNLFIVFIYILGYDSLEEYEKREENKAKADD